MMSIELPINLSDLFGFIAPSEAQKSIRAKIKESVNTMEAGDAIVIKQTLCKGGLYTLR